MFRGVRHPLVRDRGDRAVNFGCGLDLRQVQLAFFFFFQAEDGIRDIGVTGVRRVLFRSQQTPFSRVSTRGINNGSKPLKRAFVVGRLRRFAHAIAIIAAAITSAAATDLPEISLMGTLLLWDEGGIAFGDLTFWNRPLLGTATAIVVDCQFLDRDGQKVDQRKLTVEGPVYGRTIKTVRVRIGTLSENADTMACSVVDFKWGSWQQ